MAVGLVEIIKAHVDMIAIGNAQSPHERLIHVRARGLHVHNSAGRNIIRFRLVQRDGCGASQRAGVQVAAGMVLTRGHGMRDVASHSLYRSDGAQHPRVAAVLGNVNGRISTRGKRIGSERRGNHDLRIDGLDCQERFAVLIGLPAEARRNHVHNFNRWGLPADENESGDHHERSNSQKAYPEGSEGFHRRGLSGSGFP